MRDEAPIAARVSDADQVLGYGERGFGINLDPVADLVVRGRRRSCRRPGAARSVSLRSSPTAVERLGAAAAGTIVDADAALHRIRLIKDWDELEKINAAYELCWLGQQAVVGRRRARGRARSSCSRRRSRRRRSRPAGRSSSSATSSRARTPPRCAARSTSPGRRSVEEGDPVIADVVVRADGYWGDTAETHVAGDERRRGGGALGPPRRARAGADRARARRDRRRGVREHPRPGRQRAARAVSCRITAVTRSASPRFEDPHLIPSDTMPFEPWMVLAVEPGVYFPGRYGARVENIFVVTPAAASSCERRSQKCPWQLAGVHHTGYTVSDLDRSLVFYRDVLGCEVIATQEKARRVSRGDRRLPDAHVRMAHLRVPGGGHVIELFEYLAPDGDSADVEPRNVGASHLCFLVTDLPRALREAARAGA